MFYDFIRFVSLLSFVWGKRWRSWFRHYARNFSIALRTTQLLARMITSNISWGGEGEGWQPCHFYVQIVMKSGNPDLPQSSGLVQSCTGIAFACTGLTYFLHISTLFYIFSWHFNFWIHISCLLRAFLNLSSTEYCAQTFCRIDYLCCVMPLQFVTDFFLLIFFFYM